MKYDCLSSNTVKITLTKEDMREYSLSERSIALKMPEAKERLTQLLYRINPFRPYSPERLFLEAFPIKEGGCILYVSTLGEERLVCDNHDVMIFETEKADILAAVCKGLLNADADTDLCIYYIYDRYAAHIRSSRLAYERLHHFLSEYGQILTDSSALTELEEYGKLLADKGACACFAELY